MSKVTLNDVLTGLEDGINRNKEMAHKEGQKGNLELKCYHTGIAFGYEVAMNSIKQYMEQEGEGGH